MFPLAHAVGIRTYSIDDSGSRPVESWSEPVVTPVYGWSPAGTAEPFDVGRDAVTWDLDLLVPPTFTIGPKDRVVLEGEEYTVEGRANDYNNGPFGFRPGLTVRLRRVEG